MIGPHRDHVPRRLSPSPGDDWSFDGWIHIIHIPMAWKRHSGRKVTVAFDGRDAWIPSRPSPDETPIRALARAQGWKGMQLEALTRVTPSEWGEQRDQRDLIQTREGRLARNQN